MPKRNSETSKFDFMFDDRFRNLVTRDYQELLQLEPASSPKSVMVLAGSVIEGLLSDAIIATEHLTFNKIIKLTFAELIENAKTLSILTKTELSTVVRGYRNLVHPAVEIRDHVEFDDADATLSKSAVEVIVREVGKWSRYFRVLRGLTVDEQKFLALFNQEKPANSKFEHPFLDHNVYSSIVSLIIGKILSVDEIVKGEHYTQRVSIIHDAVRYVELLVFKEAAKRTSIILNLSNVAAGVGSGSGSTGSSRR